jgi:hypothetical protein
MAHIETAVENLLKIMVEQGGGKFQGIQAGFHDRRGRWVEPLVLFAEPHGSTLALPVSKVSARAVRRHVRESQAQYAPEMATKGVTA